MSRVTTNYKRRGRYSLTSIGRSICSCPCRHESHLRWRKCRSRLYLCKCTKTLAYVLHCRLQFEFRLWIVTLARVLGGSFLGVCLCVAYVRFRWRSSHNIITCLSCRFVSDRTKALTDRCNHTEWPRSLILAFLLLSTIMSVVSSSCVCSIQSSRSCRVSVVVASRVTTS